MRKNPLGAGGTGCGWEAVRTSWYLQKGKKYGTHS